MDAHQYAIQANGSFALPDACFRVRELMNDDTSSIEDFANVISVDPSMTSRLLQIANSAMSAKHICRMGRALIPRKTLTTDI